jgi:hypothetical protein
MTLIALSIDTKECTKDEMRVLIVWGYIFMFDKNGTLWHKYICNRQFIEIAKDIGWVGISFLKIWDSEKGVSFPLFLT